MSLKGAYHVESTQDVEDQVSLSVTSTGLDVLTYCPRTGDPPANGGQLRSRKFKIVRSAYRVGRFKIDKSPTGSDDSEPSESGADRRRILSVVVTVNRARGHRGETQSGLADQAHLQDLVEEAGFEGSYWSVMRFVRRLGRARQLPFRRMECGPAEEAQVDFGSGAPVITAEGRRRKTHVFASCSATAARDTAKLYSGRPPRISSQCLENAFCHFGGSVKTLVIDNLRAARDAKRIGMNRNCIRSCDRSLSTTVWSFFPPVPTLRATRKGRVGGEVRQKTPEGRRFSSLEEQNKFLLHWETTVADTRIHGTTKQQVGKLFREVERPALSPLPVERFPYFREREHTVHRDGHIQVDGAYYSVPPEYFRRKVWVRWDSRSGQSSTTTGRDRVHVKPDTRPFQYASRGYRPGKDQRVERGTEWLLRRASAIGYHADRWAQEVIASRGIEGIRTVLGLISLAGRQPVADRQGLRNRDSYGAYD